MLGYVSAYDQNGNQINGTSIFRYEGSTQVEITKIKLYAEVFNVPGEYEFATNLKPDVDFYVRVPLNSGATKLTKLLTVGVQNNKWSTVAFMQASGYQDCIEVERSGNWNDSYVMEYDYNVPLQGSMTISKTDTDTGANLGNTRFIVQYQDGQYLTGGTSGSSAGYTGNKNQATWYQPGSKINIAREGTYTFLEVQKQQYGYPDASLNSPLNVGSIAGTLGQDKTVYLKNTKQTGNLQIIKKDADNPNIVLNGVEFKIRDTSRGYLIAIGRNGSTLSRAVGTTPLGNLSYTGDINQATTFITDSNGQINISNILVGNYEITEISVGGHYGYEVNSSPTTVNVTRQTVQNTERGTPANSVTIYNKRKYVKLSGYAWEDLEWIEGKEIKTNELYRQKTLDVNDKLLEGIPVYLKDMNGNIVGRTTTNSNGAYIFNDVLIDQISNYYVEFQYNGMSYQNVKSENNNYHLDGRIVRPNQAGSNRAIEAGNRTAFNNSYSEIHYGASNQYPLTYNTAQYTSTLSYRRDKNTSNYNYGYSGNENSREPFTGIDGQYVIAANTRNTYNGGLNHIISADSIRKNSVTEITDINLGLKKRQKIDLSLIKDVNSVKVHINGADHIYNYADRFNPSLYGKYNDQGKNGHDMEPLVKFQSKYSNMSYTRALYASDINYTGDDTLKVYATYKIGIRNSESNLTGVINELNTYFDTKYEFVGAGREINSDGSIKPGTNVRIGNVTTQDGFQKISLYPSVSVGSQEQYVYIQLQVKPDQIIDILDKNNEVVKLDCITEIASYTVKDQSGNIYAAIDKDSQPGNSRPNNKATFEDDTDKAPGLKLVLQEEREISGVVFEDTVTTGNKDLSSGNVRQGDGRYIASQDKGIANIEVRLVNAKTGEIAKKYNTVTKQWEDAVTVSDSNGNYKIAGMIPVPDNYKVVYVWGDEKYKVQDYKSTVVDKSSYEAKEKQLEWYKDEFKEKYPNTEWNTQSNTEIRVSDAVDNYETRKDIDEQASLVTNSNQNVIIESNGELEQKNGTKEEITTKMDAITPTFRVNLEYYTTPSDIGDNEYELNSDGSVKMNGIYAVKKEQYKNHLKNIDFGIVERAKQVISLNKEIRNAKLILSDGVVLINANIEDGKLKDSVQHTVYIPDSEGAKGQVKFELDNEISQGVRLELSYALKTRNISELDYLNEEFYRYGKGYGENESDLVTLDATNVIDYLDNNVSTALEDIDIGEVIRDNNKKLQYITEKGWLENTQAMKDLLTTTNQVVDITKLSKDLKPQGDNTQNEVILKAYRILANTAIDDEDEGVLENYAEIIRVEKSGGASLITIPGNYTPNTNSQTEYDSDTSESLTIVPPTGRVTDYIAYAMLAISTLGILVAGIILIKKLVI